MIKRAALKRTVAATLRSFQLMLLGALLLAMGLDVTGHEIKNLSSSLIMTCLIVGSLTSFLAPQAAARPSNTPSPRASGVAVIAITGTFATIAMAKGGLIGEPNLIGAAAVALGTIAACIAIWRFATKNAGEIGEARFPT